MGKLTVEDTSLVSVANAIRTKGGTSEGLTFPDGFVSAIEGIQSGVDNSLFLSMVEGTITEVTAEMLEGCTKIRQNAFAYISTIKSIVIPESVTYYGTNVFSNCNSLSSVVIPEGIKTITTYMFQNCLSLTSIVIPESVTALNYGAFYGCLMLSNITIPKNVSSIGASVFSNCTALTTVKMYPTTPPTFTSSAFSGCSSLTTIIVPAGSLSAYQSATNWSVYASKMVEATE